MWNKKKKQENKLEDPWRCVICGCKNGIKNNHLSDYYKRASSDNRFCVFCVCNRDKERDRRIEFMRRVVGSVVYSPSPYRDNVPDTTSAWATAKALANTDPYRDKRYDAYIKL